MEPLDLCIKIRQLRFTVSAAEKKSTRIPNHTIHVTNELVWRPNLFPGTKCGELGSRTTQCFLRSIRERCKKVL
jgi:hypothetical protein